MDENITLEPTPELPLAPPKKTSPILPILLGVFFVVILTSTFAGFYYFAQLKKEVSTQSQSPTPVPSITTSEQDVISSATPSATPAVSLTPSFKPSTKPSLKPSATPTTSPSTAPLTTTSSLDIRFSNPSAHIKQTIDEGSGDGRVINREFSSIQVGEFDEVKVAWSPKVTVCFHVVSNQDLEGAKLGYTLTENDKIISEGTLSQYSKIEAGKTYDVCHDSTIAIGSHKLQLNINNTHSLPESTYANNIARLDFKNLEDKIPPNYTLAGPYNWHEKGTCFLITYPDDNVTPVSNLKVEHKVDTADWTTHTGAEYCFKGDTGSSHTYKVRLTDARGNKNEQTNTFNLY